jgi:tRNA G10  N-methylase Trm11
MVEAARRNLAHYNLQGEINLADATKVSGQFDAVITNLPYGITLIASRAQEREIMQNTRHLAPKTTFVAIRDLTADLLDFGYRIRQRINAKKHTITRQIFVTETD